MNVLLREVIQEAADSFDFVVIDGEAGIEQVNRRVMERVSHLLLVTDGSTRGQKVADTIEGVTRKSIALRKVGLVINRVRDEMEVEEVRRATRLPVIGWIPEDETLYRFDRERGSFVELPECPSVRAMTDLVGFTAFREHDVGSGLHDVPLCQRRGIEVRLAWTTRPRSFASGVRNMQARRSFSWQTISILRI